MMCLSHTNQTSYKGSVNRMVAELAEFFVSTVYILGIVVVGSLVISVAMATIQRVIFSIVDAFTKHEDNER
jgi:hypothetical protein